MTATVEFSRCVAIAEVEATPREIAIAADGDERAALARRFDLVALTTLTATVTLERMPGRAVLLRGRLHADVAQRCVVTLDTLEVKMDEAFEIRFLPGDDAADDIAFDPLIDDVVEPLPEAIIDIGEIVAQQLGLASDPYPRQRGAKIMVPETTADSPTDRPSSPFAILRDRGPGRQGRPG